MRLRTRLTTAVVIVSSAGTLLLGGVSISEVRNGKVDAVDRTLLAVTEQAASNKADQLGAALLAADQSPTAVALGFAAPGAGFTWLHELPDENIPSPGSRLLKAAFAGPLTTTDGYRMTAIRLRDGEELVVAASLTDIGRQTVSDIVSLATFWVVLSLFMWVVIRLLVRRDTAQIERLVAVASDIAAGVEDVEIPARASSSEVDTLAAALRRLVASLRGAVLTEQATNARMQEFLGDASHELRTPLTVIKGYLELLERDVEPQQRERALLRMLTEAQRMELLIEDLLLLAEVGTPVPEQPEHIDLTALVRVFVDDLRELQPERPVDASIATGIVVSAIPSHLHRAIGNAFANLRRHTSPSVPVRVHLLQVGDEAALVIEDGGPGLPASVYETGMAHFRRFDKSRSRASGGSGLGMSIVAAVMAELGGSVAIEPSDLGGLRLRYRFPIRH